MTNLFGKKLGVIGLLLSSQLAMAAGGAIPAVIPVAPEDWKGEADTNTYRLGALAGLGIIDSTAGFALLGTASRKIVTRGFSPEINNSVWLELQAGPLFISGGTAFAYSTHLRWDFHRTNEWTYYALGGLSGHITGEALGSRFLLFPRFGLGLLKELTANMAIRAELSHEFITAGASWFF